ncbi:MAG: hypothetical protein LBL39_00405 [Planctomycetaceae bacterium]|jgi:hypothetical protein|nr:hypothetical protein [Planctomycetaceae bacterium]
MNNGTVHSISSLPELRDYVYRTLCRDHELLVDAFPTSESVLKRGNADSCGVMFCLHGPRSVKYSAIWEKDKGRVLFYGPSGKRYHQVELSDTAIEFER